MDKVRMTNADRDLLVAVSNWAVSRLEDDPAIQELMKRIQCLVDEEHTEEVTSLLYDILGRAGDMAAEVTMKKLL